MARRRYRKTRSRRGRRGFRRRSRVYKKIASINRRLAAEVKKNDNAIFVGNGAFAQLTDVGLNDYAYIYPVVDASMKQGTQLDDIIGESIKLKYLYLGFHLQQMSFQSTQGTSSLYPVTLRVMVVQDRNYRQYNGGVPESSEMFTNLFGFTNTNTTQQYGSQIDVTLLPLNPLEPGRFQILRDFKMSVAPGWKSDTYKKVMILQSRTNSHGKIYFGPTHNPQIETLWTNPVGISAHETGGFMYFDHRVTGSGPRGSQTELTGGRLGPYRIWVERTIAWPAVQSEQWPYQVVVPNSGEPGDVNIDFSTSRNGIYVVVLRQATPVLNASGAYVSAEPQFGLSIQSRMAYYDN